MTSLHPVNPAQMAAFERLASDARPTSDADWGSERQIDAENLFFAAIGFGDDEFALGEAFRDFSAKATTDELIDEALRILRLRVEG